MLGKKGLAKVNPGESTRGENKEFLFVSNEVKEKSDLDTDSDGLKDWEEVLWGTDINKIDSDGDGTGDSEEVLVKRNPAISGPDDLLLSTEEMETELTQTDLLARSLLVGYAGLKQAGTLDKKQESFVNSLVENSVSEINSFENKYSTSNLNIINKDDEITLKNYGLELISVLDVFKTLENDAVLLTNYLENKDKSSMEEIKNNIIVYETIKEDLLKMSVPKGVGFYHIGLINSVDYLIFSVNKFTTANTDIILSLSSTNGYLKSLNSIMEYSSKIGKYLANKGVVIK